MTNTGKHMAGTRKHKVLDTGRNVRGRKVYRVKAQDKNRAQT